MEEEKCKVNQSSKIFAYIALIYIISCIIYLIMTRDIGTPFNDALMAYPNLEKIKESSTKIRSNIFYMGVLVAIILIIIIRPF